MKWHKQCEAFVDDDKGCKAEQLQSTQDLNIYLWVSPTIEYYW
jgi:hypothetical protein